MAEAHEQKQRVAKAKQAAKVLVQQAEGQTDSQLTPVNNKNSAPMHAGRSGKAQGKRCLDIESNDGNEELPNTKRQVRFLSIH
jgi:hypothetical protein